MKIERTSAAELPLTKAELRKFANLHTPDYDGELDAFQGASVDDIQGLAHCKIGSATYTLYADSFEDADLPLSLFPITRITSITYLDTDEVEQTLSSSEYQYDALAFPQRLLYTGSNLPSVASSSDAPINPIRIHVAAGYGDTTTGVPLEYQSVPRNLEQAVKHLTLHRFLNRAATGAASMLTEIPYGVSSIVGRHKKRRVW